MPAETPDLHWFVLLCEPNRERTARDYLQNLEFNVFLPMMLQELVRSHRTLFGMQRIKSKRSCPIFPGYLFIQLNLAWGFGPLYITPGLRTGPRQDRSPFFKVDNKPAKLSNEAIEYWRRAERTLSNPQVVGLPFRVGNNVRLIDGALEGMVGEISRMDDAERIELLMDMLGGKTKVLVNAQQIELDGG